MMKKLSHWGTIAGLTMGAFPDSDFVLGLFNRQFYLEYHRNFTHSLLLAPFLRPFLCLGFCEAVEAAPHLEFLQKMSLLS